MRQRFIGLFALAVSGALTVVAAGCGGSGSGASTATRLGSVTSSSSATQTKPPTASTTTATGRIAFVRGKRQGSVIFTISSDGSGLRELTRQRTPHDQVSALVASPDGRWLAYSGGLFGFNGDRAYDDLFVVSSSGGSPRRITHNPDDDWDPAWSADGKLLAFDRQADGYHWVFVARVDGSRVKRLTPNFRWNPTWSPNGRIAYNTRQGEIWTMDADGQHKRLLAAARIFIGGYEGERPVAWSPDGRLIAYSTGDAIWVMKADGSHRRKLYSAQGLEGKTHPDPVWSPDSRSIA